MKALRAVLIVLSSVFVLAACSSSADNNSETGFLTLTLTDAPFPIDMVSQANVTITKIDIRRDSTEVDDAVFETISEEVQSFNLLDLQNGVKSSLADLQLEVGSYDLVRLFVDEASVVLKDGSQFDLNIPSGAQTGIKVFISPSIEVTGGLTSELLLDFDVANSFVVRGNPNTPAGINGFNFKPTIKAVNASTAGRIEGVVTDTLGTNLENIQIAVIANADSSIAFTNDQGFYSIISLDAGNYSIEATSADYDSVKIEAVSITAGNLTTQNFELTPKQ
jgi:hypothetical protein